MCQVGVVMADDIVAVEGAAYLAHVGQDGKLAHVRVAARGAAVARGGRAADKECDYDGRGGG